MIKHLDSSSVDFEKSLQSVISSTSEPSKSVIETVSKIIRSGWLTHGKYTTFFEKEFKKFTNSKYAISVSSCTAGLHLSCLASGFKKGDEIIGHTRILKKTATLVFIFCELKCNRKIITSASGVWNILTKR